MFCYGVYFDFLLATIYVRQSLAKQTFEGEYRISNQMTNWSDAFEQCQIATPERTHCHHGYNCRLKINTVAGISDVTNDELWVGYYKINMSLNHIGCINISTIPSDFDGEEGNYRKNAQKCFRKCLTSTLIGIAKYKCYCLRNLNLIPDKARYCNKECDGFQCGKASHVSVYQNGKNGKEEKSWQTEKPRDIETIVEYGATDINSSTFDDKQYGYITRDGDKHLLKFTSDNSHKRALCKKKAPQTTTYKKYHKGHDNKKDKGKKNRHRTKIILTDETATKADEETITERIYKMTTKITDKTTTNATDKTTIKATKETITELIYETTTEANEKIAKTPTDGTTASSKSTNNTESQDFNTSENNYAKVLVYVGVVLAIFVVVAMAAVLVYRRYKLSHRFDKKSTTNERAVIPEYNYPDFTFNMPNNDIDQHALHTVEYNYPDFSILTVLKSTEEVFVSGNKEEKVELSTYKHKKLVYGKSDHDNIYNTISTRPMIVAMEMYDHTILGTNSGINSSDDNIYDLSMSANAQLQSNLGGLTDNVYNTDNDTYNKLNGDWLEVGKSTDNFYGNRQTEVCRDVLKPKPRKDKIYDSTSQSIELSRVTDNTYSKLEAD